MPFQLESHTSDLSKALLLYQGTIVPDASDNALQVFVKKTIFESEIRNYYDIVILVRGLAHIVGFKRNSEKYKNLRHDFASFYQGCPHPTSHGSFLYHCIDYARRSNKR